jgi:inhibitor of cysteine peptidase
MTKSVLFALILGAWTCTGRAEVEKVNVGPVQNPPAGSAPAGKVTNVGPVRHPPAETIAAEKAIDEGPVEYTPAGSEIAESLEVRLTQEGGSRSGALVRGQNLAVFIAGNPSTGYQWELTGPVDAAVLEQEGRAEFVAGAPDLAGAPGEYQFVFKAVGLGTTVVGFKYVRPWEKDNPPAATASVNVTVTE